MKKNLLWMFAAILTCGLTMTSCAVDDLPVDPANQPVVTVLDFEDTEAEPAFVANKLSYEIVQDETEENGTKVAKFTYAGKGYCFAPYAFEDMENATRVLVSFDFCFPADIAGQSAIVLSDAFVHNLATGGFNTGTPQYGFGVNGAIFYLGGSRGKINGANQNYFWVNGTPVATTESEEGRKATDIWGKWFHADFDVNVVNKTLNFTIKHGDDIFYEATDSAFINENAETCTQLGVFLGNAGSILLDNISVTKKAKDISIKYADYTVKYVDTEGNPLPEDLKAPVVRRGKVGTEITLLDSDKSNMQTADGSVKYIYQSDNSEGATITEEGTVITVVFKAEEVAKYKYIINGMINGVSGAEGRLFMFQGEEYVGKTTTYYLPIGCGKNGAYYFVTPKTYNGYDVSINGSEETQAGYILTTVTYDLDPNVVYFADCEDMEIVGETINGYNFGIFNRVSQGKHIRLAAGTSMTTKDAISVAGTYEIALYGRSDSGTSYPVTIYIIASDGTETKVEAAASPESFGNAGMGWFTFSNVAIPAGAKLKFVNETEGTGFGYDCLKVFKPTIAE